VHRFHAPAPAHRPLVLPAAFLAALLLVSCGGDGDGLTETVVVNLAKASGDAQTGAVSALLFEPLVVRVTDQNGAPLTGRPVAWRVTAGSATLESSSSSSVAGLAGNHVTLGAQAGAVTIVASIGDEEVEFTATALVPAALSIVSGDDQNGATLDEFPVPLVVRVTDASGTPVPVATVNWSVTTGGATLSSSTSTTNPDGTDTEVLTGGTALEDIEVQAELFGTASSVTFSARVTVFVIDMIDTSFEGPSGAADAIVAVGDTVEWFNRDVAIGAHTATSSSTPAGGSAFDSGNMAVNATFRFVPDAVGTWDYFCVIHGVAAMSGTLTAQ
jgi:plastocyanin